MSACLLTLCLIGCGDAGSRVDTVEPLQRPIGDRAGDDDPNPTPPPIRRGGEGPESVLQFGLFGPVVPAAGTEAWESDCRFEDDPYETCL